MTIRLTIDIVSQYLVSPINYFVVKESYFSAVC